MELRSALQQQLHGVEGILLDSTFRLLSYPAGQLAVSRQGNHLELLQGQEA
jgi:hypothetical protein